MDKKRMKRMIGIAIPRALIITGISYNGYIRTHTFTLSGGVVKNELIQPINNKIKVSGNADTDVIFTDIESRKQYTIGYITHGMSETIQLEKGKWYSVEGAGELTIRPVNCIELVVTFLFTLRYDIPFIREMRKSKVSRKFLDIMAIIIQMVGVVILSLFVLLAVVQ